MRKFTTVAIAAVTLTAGVAATTTASAQSGYDGRRYVDRQSDRGYHSDHRRGYDGRHDGGYGRGYYDNRRYDDRRHYGRRGNGGDAAAAAIIGGVLGYALGAATRPSYGYNSGYSSYPSYSYGSYPSYAYGYSQPSYGYGYSQPSYGHGYNYGYQQPYYGGHCRRGYYC